MNKKASLEIDKLGKLLFALAVLLALLLLVWFGKEKMFAVLADFFNKLRLG
ncbi:MAG: hypothetical protein PHD81_02165 [Candidatus Nanoarchaeia archaeon]|nr:hypothetical protein [Candidatus Nanoarchaeia archaeon]MDD5587895.1 hypothetical protein [Candidatus Nanoarchaeia archaeon]